MNVTLLKYVKTEQITSLLYTLGPLQLTLSMLYVYVLFAHFLSQSSAIPSGLYPSQALWPLKLQILSLSGCLFNSPPPFFFQAYRYGDLFSLCTCFCVSLFLTLLSTVLSHSSLLSQILSPHFLSSLMWPFTYH